MFAIMFMGVVLLDLPVQMVIKCCISCGRQSGLLLTCHVSGEVMNRLFVFLLYTTHSF